MCHRPSSASGSSFLFCSLNLYRAPLAFATTSTRHLTIRPPRSPAARSRLIPLPCPLRWACCIWVLLFVVQLFDTPCTHCAAVRADRWHSLRTPCKYRTAARAGRCCLLHTPCTDCAAARAGTCCLLHTPCTDCAAAHAGRSLPLHTPCT